MEQKLRVIGASWCPDCKRAKTFLGQHRIEFDWVDMESDPTAQAEVERINDGKRIIPTIIFPDGSILTEPSNDELAEKLGIVREAAFDSYDVLIAGGGPTALTTAIYAARENLKVLIVEKSAVGGQAGVTERFDNYPGFPEGYAGLDVTLSTGAVVQTRVLLVATGSTYRRTGADGEADLIGAGIHFCATCDGPFYKGAEEVVVLGGGNSGLEEGLFLTQFANHITVIERGGELRGSKLLQDKVYSHPKMTVRLNEAVQSFIANEAGQLAGVELENLLTKERSTHSAKGAFIFIGLDPNTEWLNGTVALDERKFVATDQMFSTSARGVFAAGDVRSGSTKQLASAVGEGAAAAIQIRYFLDKLEK